MPPTLASPSPPGIATAPANGPTQPAAPKVQASSKPPASTKRARAPGGVVVLAALGGFVAGVVFWHFVGFWSFVNQVVFKSDRDPVTAVAAAREADDDHKLPTTVFGGIPAAGHGRTAGCSILRLDRNTGRTSSVPCDPPARVPHVAGWAATIKDAIASPTGAPADRE